jgi:RING finger protein 113A
VKAPTNIRTITVTDFAPDVCKDYKQTGFCGYGDSCKFLHAREDYKQGWQLDREWENVTKGKKVTGGTKIASVDRNAEADNSDDDDAMLEHIPFACIICREPYKDPIVTKCGHYFCEACALKRYRKDPSCAACGAGTGGVFNVERKRKRAAERRAKAIEAGEEVSDDDEDEG